MTTVVNSGKVSVSVFVFCFVVLVVAALHSQWCVCSVCTEGTSALTASDTLLTFPWTGKRSVALFQWQTA